MKILTFKKLIACCSLLIAMVACKKNTVEPTEQIISAGNPTKESASKTLLDTRKTLLVLDYRYNIDLNTSNFTLYRVNGLASTPYKYPLFIGETNFDIMDVCPGPGVNNAYFLYEPKNVLSENEGIWNITLDGKKKTQIVKQFVGGGAYELDVDRVNNKIYWGGGPTSDKMQIWRCNADGSQPTKIVILGVPEVGRFAVDGVGKRIFFQYKKNNMAVVGCCDLNGKIITPIVAMFDNEVFPNTSKEIILDIPNQKFYMNTGATIFVGGMKDINKSAKLLWYSIDFGYQGLSYDFSKSLLYFSKGGNSTTLFSSNFQGGNEKVVVGGFSSVFCVSGMFTDQ